MAARALARPIGCSGAAPRGSNEPGSRITGAVVEIGSGRREGVDYAKGEGENGWLTLLVAVFGCFIPVPVPDRRDEDRLEAEHRDPHVVVLENEPAAERVCWRHRNHWHCYR